MLPFGLPVRPGFPHYGGNCAPVPTKAAGEGWEYSVLGFIEPGGQGILTGVSHHVREPVVPFPEEAVSILSNPAPGLALIWLSRRISVEARSHNVFLRSRLSKSLGGTGVLPISGAGLLESGIKATGLWHYV